MNDQPYQTLDEICRRAILDALQEQKTQTRAAKKLGISRRSMSRKCRRYGITRLWINSQTA